MRLKNATTLLTTTASDETIQLAHYGKDIGDHLSLENLYAELDKIKVRRDATQKGD